MKRTVTTAFKIIVNFFGADVVKGLSIQLLKYLSSKTDNNVDDKAVEIIENLVFPENVQQSSLIVEKIVNENVDNNNYIISEKLLNHIKKSEGFMPKPYVCPGNKLSIGYGRNLDDVGISKSEAQYLGIKFPFELELRIIFNQRGISEKEATYLMINDLHNCLTQLYRNIEFFETLDNARKDVLIDMCFNLGIGGLLKFKKTLEHIKNQEWMKAGDEMLCSKWAKQVGKRAITLSEIMKKGTW